METWYGALVFLAVTYGLGGAVILWGLWPVLKDHERRMAEHEEIMRRAGKR